MAHPDWYVVYATSEDGGVTWKPYSGRQTWNAANRSLAHVALWEASQRGLSARWHKRERYGTRGVELIDAEGKVILLLDMRNAKDLSPA